MPYNQESRHRIILDKPEDWDGWISHVKGFISDPSIWDLVNPEMPVYGSISYIESLRCIGILRFSACFHPLLSSLDSIPCLLPSMLSFIQHLLLCTLAGVDRLGVRGSPLVPFIIIIHLCIHPFVPFVTTIQLLLSSHISNCSAFNFHSEGFAVKNQFHPLMLCSMILLQTLQILDAGEQLTTHS